MQNKISQTAVLEIAWALQGADELLNTKSLTLLHCFVMFEKYKRIQSSATSLLCLLPVYQSLAAAKVT